MSQSWTIGWGEYLATSRNIVYVLMDARGTGGQSNEFLFSVSCGWWIVVLPNGTGPGVVPFNFHFPGSPGNGSDSAR